LTGSNSPSSVRHIEVLDAAMVLIAERGVRGATLRELADRIGIKQPSLYHYFESKDALITQIIEHRTGQLLQAPDPLPVLDSVEQLVAMASQFVLGLYSSDEYVAFVRFLFAVSIERAEWSGLVRERFVEGFKQPFALLAQPLVERGELHADDLDYVGTLVSSAMILQMLNYRVLLRQPMDLQRWQPEISFLTETLSAGLRARTRRLNGEPGPHDES